MRETLTSVERPHRFGYDDRRRPRADEAARRAGRGAVDLRARRHRHPHHLAVGRDPDGGRSRLAMPVFARMWRGYARQALEEVESVLLR